jgi:hypothetical protein
MNLPSFTAEATLYKTGGHYRTGGSFNLKAGIVVPQQGLPYCAPSDHCVSDCYTECIKDGGAKDGCKRMCELDCGCRVGTGGVPVLPRKCTDADYNWQKVCLFAKAFCEYLCPVPFVCMCGSYKCELGCQP